MAEPISEQILANVKTRLLNHTTDVQRSPRVAAWQPKNGTLVVNLMTIEENESLSCPGNPPAKAWDMEVEICALLKPSDRDITAIDSYRNRIHADIVAICSDGIPRWHTWGDLAIDSRFTLAEPYTDDDGAFAGIKTTLFVTFRTDEDNPYNLRA